MADDYNCETLISLVENGLKTINNKLNDLRKVVPGEVIFDFIVFIDKFHDEDLEKNPQLLHQISGYLRKMKQDIPNNKHTKDLHNNINGVLGIIDQAVNKCL